MVYFIIYFFIEVMVTTNIASQIGGLMTFIEIVLSAFIGLFLLTNFRYTLAKSMSSVLSGELTAQEFQKMSLFTLFGAILLIVPGFFSDMLGVLLQFTFFGTFFAKKILHLKTNKTTMQRKDNDAIDVEIIDNINTK